MMIESGRTMAHYRLVEKIGEGGMGIVWKALDTTLDREVAIKILSETFSGDEAELARFEREAKLLASINHPNVATVYGLHRDEGISFLALELIPGQDLAQRLDKKPLTVARSLTIARQIAAALQATHACGVIHRDLKPANVYVTPEGGVKVLDFGIARAASSNLMGQRPLQSDPGSSDRTQPGSIVGTVSYMSPEQARGKIVDARTDLWAFGCVLYRMLCGRLAFEGETRWDKLAAVLREEPNWGALPSDTPGEVRKLLKRCLEKEVDRRIDSADEAGRILDEALAEFSLTGELTTDVGPMHVDDLANATSKPVLWAIIGVLVLVIAAAVLWNQFGEEGADQAAINPRSIAVLPFESLGGGDGGDAFTAGIHDDVLNHLAKIGNLKVISRTSVMEYRDTTVNLTEIGERLGVATLLEGAVRRSGQQVRINVQLIDAASGESLWAESYNRELTADEIFDIQSDIAEQIAGELQATLSAGEKRRLGQQPTSDLAAYDFYLGAIAYFNRPGQIEANLVASRKLFNDAINLDPSFALAFSGLSRAARDQYWFTGGTQEDLATAISAAERAIELDPSLPEAHLALGTTLYVTRNYEDALAELEIAERGLHSNSELMRWKAYVVRRQGDWPRALRELQRANSLDPLDAEAANEIGFTMMCMRRYDEAASSFERALSLAPDLPEAQIYLALIPVLRDGTHEATEMAARLLEAAPDKPWKFAHGWQTKIYVRDFDGAVDLVSYAERVTGQWHDYPTELLVGLARQMQGRTGEATPQLEAARQLLEADVLAHPIDARLFGALGLAYAGLGRKEDALRAGRHAVKLMPLERDIFVGAWQLQDLAWIYLMTDEPQLAAEAFNEVLAVPAVFSMESLMLDPRIEPLRRFRKGDRFIYR